MGYNFQWNIKTTEVSANCGTSFFCKKLFGGWIKIREKFLLDFKFI